MSPICNHHQHAGAAPGHGGGGMVADRSMTGDDEGLAAPLSVLGLSVRASNALLNSGFSTVGDIVARTETELAGLPSIGAFTIIDIKTKLIAHSLTLRANSPGPRKSRRRSRTAERPSGEERLRLLVDAKQGACDCGTWFLWRLRSGGSWHRYACKPMPDGMAQRRDVQIINVARVPLHVLRAVLLA
jgi:hypothetical protein